MKEVQKWYQSKTLWVAVIQAVAGAVLYTIGNDPEVATALGGNAILMTVLRLITSKPLKF